MEFTNPNLVLGVQGATAASNLPILVGILINIAITMPTVSTALGMKDGPIGIVVNMEMVMVVVTLGRVTEQAVGSSLTEELTLAVIKAVKLFLRS